MRIIPGELPTAQFHAFLLGAVSPRPICFASTIDKDGNPNLSPYSFFNVFGSNPATLIFSPARRVRDNTIKHTLENIRATGEVVINAVSYAMVQQMSLSSCEYPAGTNEFTKAGFTQVAGEMVKPFRVGESPASFECRVKDIIETGTEGGAGNLIICELLCMHLSDSVLGEDGQIDPHKIDLVARMGGDYYCRASGASVFTVPKPARELGIGVDALPAHIRNSRILTGNHLGMLGNSPAIPVVEALEEDGRLVEILRHYETDAAGRQTALHHYAAELLSEEQVTQAWAVLLAGGAGGRDLMG